MALSAQHRSILYTEFVDRLGPDVTEAFLAEFPAREGDEPITRDFPRTDLGGQMMQLQLAVAALEARIAQSEAAFQKESKRQLAIIVTAILGTGTAVLAGMAVSVAIIVSRMG